MLWSMNEIYLQLKVAALWSETERRVKERGRDSLDFLVWSGLYLIEEMLGDGTAEKKLLSP